MDGVKKGEIPIFGSKDCKVHRSKETNPCKVMAFPREKEYYIENEFYFFRYGYSDDKNYGESYEKWLEKEDINLGENVYQYFDYGHGRDTRDKLRSKTKSKWNVWKPKYVDNYNRSTNVEFGKSYRPTVNILETISDYVFKFKLEENDSANPKLSYYHEQIAGTLGGVDVPVEINRKIKLYYEKENDNVGISNKVHEFNETEYLIYSPLMLNYSTNNNNSTINGLSIKGLHPYTGDKGSTKGGWDNHLGHKYHRLTRGILAVLILFLV